MSESWDEHAPEWDGNADVRLYAEQAFASLGAIADITDPVWRSKRVLDFGCGTGLLAEKIAPFVTEVIAVDSSAEMVAVLRAKGIGNVTALHADILDEQFDRETGWFSDFDLICASSVCAFLADYEAAVRLLAGALKPGGRFVQWDWQGDEADGFGLSETRIENALKAAGLRAIRVEKAFSMQSEEGAMPVLVGSGMA